MPEHFSARQPVMITNEGHAIADFFAVSPPRFPLLSRKGLRAMETEHAKSPKFPAFRAFNSVLMAWVASSITAIPRSIATASSLFICISLFPREQLSHTMAS
jgi:hypothetical protein